MGKWLLTIVCLIAVAILTRWIPFSPYFRNLDTMIHEFGHAIVTLLLRGDVHYIYLFEDHSGVTLSSVDGSYTGIAVGLAGYTTASLFCVYLFRSWRNGQQRQALAVMLAIAVVCLALFVRNPYGMMWTAGFIALTAASLVLGRTLRNAYYLLLAFLTLEESVFGPVTLWIASTSTPGEAGGCDVACPTDGVARPVVGIRFYRDRPDVRPFGDRPFLRGPASVPQTASDPRVRARDESSGGGPLRRRIITMPLAFGAARPPVRQKISPIGLRELVFERYTRFNFSSIISCS